MRKHRLLVLLLLLMSLLTQQTSSCPPTGHHLGVIISGALSPEEVLARLQLVGINARHEVIQHKLTSGEDASFETVVFEYGQWLPTNPLTGQPIRADARLYIGKKSMALKVNTSLSGSPEPLRKAIALLYKANVIDYLPKQQDFILTEGNRVPADVVIAWAKQEFGYDVKQLILKCKSSGADVLIPFLMPSKEVVVIANNVDARLSYSVLREALALKGLNHSLIKPTEFKQHLDAEILIILGGPEAYEGVGNISEFFLSPSDSEYLKRKDSSYIVYLAQPLFEGQRIFILAGNDRFDTKRAVENFIEDFLECLLEKRPSLRYEFETNHMLPPRNVIVRGYPCMLFVEVFSTLRTPCYKPIVNFQIKMNKIEIRVEYVQLPVFCIQVITMGDLRIFIEDLLPGNYEVTIFAPEGRFLVNVSIPAC